MTRLFITAAACVALAACNNSDREADEPAAAETTAAASATTGSAAGTYEVAMADGTVVTQTLRSDGTYSDVADGEVTETGTWRMDGTQLCYEPEGDEAESCYASGEVGPDGAFQARDADGNVTFTVRRIGDETMVTEPAA